MNKSKKALKGLGHKYGTTVRKRYSRVWLTLKAKRRCPKCGHYTLNRTANGIWECDRCGYKVAGGAYTVS